MGGASGMDSDRAWHTSSPSRPTHHSTEAQLLAALHNLGDTPDLNDALLVLRVPHVGSRLSVVVVVVVLALRGAPARAHGHDGSLKRHGVVLIVSSHRRAHPAMGRVPGQRTLGTECMAGSQSTHRHRGLKNGRHAVKSYRDGDRRGAGVGTAYAWKEW